MGCRRALVAGLAACVLTIDPHGALAQTDELIEFEIEDQHRQVHRDADFAGRIVVLIGSDRGGSQYNGAWTRAIREALSTQPRRDEVSFVALADTRGVPFFIRKMVRGKFPATPEDWVLLDWKGRFAKAYGFAPDASNILVFAADRRLLMHRHGREVSQETLDPIVGALLAQLAPQP